MLLCQGALGFGIWEHLGQGMKESKREKTKYEMEVDDVEMMKEKVRQSSG